MKRERKQYSESDTGHPSKNTYGKSFFINFLFILNLKPYTYTNTKLHHAHTLNINFTYPKITYNIYIPNIITHPIPNSTQRRNNNNNKPSKKQT